MAPTEAQIQFLENQKTCHYDLLLKLSRVIHSNPACGYTEGEKVTKNKICDILDEFKFKFDGEPPKNFFKEPAKRSVKAGEVEFETAFQWDIGVWQDFKSPPPPVVFNAEYDSLPFTKGPLHACGHNLICTGSVAAAIFAANWMIEQKKTDWHIRVFGTPSEERNGAKTEFAKCGLYNESLGCMMCHPAAGPDNVDLAKIDGVAMSPSLASKLIWTVYKGRPAHAALNPWDGDNALDAAVIAYNAISVLRQQVQPENRICPIINCGSASNMIPGYAKIVVGVRAQTNNDLEDLTKRVRKCFQAGADATNCTTEPSMPGEEKDTGKHLLSRDPNQPGEKPFPSENAFESETYMDTISNELICQEFTKAVQHLGLPGFRKSAPGGEVPKGSTDQGNVTYKCPGMHAGYVIVYSGASGGNHTEPFAKAAGEEKGFKATLACAAGMAVVAEKLMTNKEYADEVQEKWKLDIKDRQTSRDYASSGSG